jgi:predicted HTH transcriptional regulator
MWSPRTWSELEELLGIAEETPSLEFKRQIAKDTAEVAKDIAAMTVNGGVIVYGMDEDKRAQLAMKIVVMPLRGVEERLHSIAGMKIAPVPAFDVTLIRENPEDSEGAVVLTVAPSTLAPHCVEGRFPCREGTITRYLTEPEIARFYELRRTSAGERPNPGQLPGGFAHSLQLVRIDDGGAEPRVPHDVG